jgi:hypothetical protein
MNRPFVLSELILQFLTRSFSDVIFHKSAGADLDSLLAAQEMAEISVDLPEVAPILLTEEADRIVVSTLPNGD